MHMILASRLLSKDNHAIATREIVRGAERHARGYHLLAGQRNFSMIFISLLGLFRLSDGNVVLTEGDRIYMALHNRGHRIVYVSVFDVSPAGEICLISGQGETGIPIKPGQISRIGESTFSILTGLGISWPESRRLRYWRSGV